MRDTLTFPDRGSSCVNGTAARGNHHMSDDLAWEGPSDALRAVRAPKGRKAIDSDASGQGRCWEYCTLPFWAVAPHHPTGSGLSPPTFACSLSVGQTRPLLMGRMEFVYSAETAVLVQPRS